MCDDAPKSLSVSVGRDAEVVISYQDDTRFWIMTHTEVRAIMRPTVVVEGGVRIRPTMLCSEVCPPPAPQERESSSVKTCWSESTFSLFIIEMVWWTGLAPWDFELTVPGSLISIFLVSPTPQPRSTNAPHRSPYREKNLDSSLVSARDRAAQLDPIYIFNSFLNESNRLK